MLVMLAWLAELVAASYFLSHGAEVISKKYGARFVGRTLLSIATTLPEIAIVIYAASDGSYGTAIGAGLGSNLLMMSLGVALMLFVATTRLSKAPLKGIDVSMFKLDKIFLLITAVLSAILFIDGYSFVDGIIFTGLFGAYIVMAFREMVLERKNHRKITSIQLHPEHIAEVNQERIGERNPGRKMIIASLTFCVGTIGIFIGADPFVHSLQGVATDIGISVVILAVVISPIAGEMPEKISMILLARKGAAGASIAVANVLGSKILNNTLLLAVAVFGAVYHAGFSTVIPNSPSLQFQVILVTAVTLAALAPMVKRHIGLKTGIMLATMYVFAISVQFIIPQDVNLK